MVERRGSGDPLLVHERAVEAVVIDDEIIAAVELDLCVPTRNCRRIGVKDHLARLVAAEPHAGILKYKCRSPTVDELQFCRFDGCGSWRRHRRWSRGRYWLNWRLLCRLQERGGRHPLYSGGCLVLMLLLPNWARFEPDHPKERPVHSELDAVPHRDAHRL